MAVQDTALGLGDVEHSSLSGSAVWCRRIGLFSLQLILAALLMHRFLSMPTPVAQNLIFVGAAGGVCAVLLGLVAIAIIWRKGLGGALSATAGLFAGLLITAMAAATIAFAANFPSISDISTDVQNPPPFKAIAGLRPKDANPTAYPGQSNAAQQVEAYPDIRPLAVQRSAVETFEVIGDTIRRMRWSVVSEDPPPAPGQPGYIEAIDRTLVFGFRDDIVIRVQGDYNDSRVDVRSASRYGAHDFGRNATRVREFYKELRARLEASVTSESRRGRRARPSAAVPKRQKGASAPSQDLRKSQGRGSQGAQRGPQSKERPR